jgi:(3,5-dihydroxyphenyl)acetyl-CoA 1,2-dioxygenase
MTIDMSLLNKWLEMPPTLCGVLERDANELTQYILVGEKFFAKLPDKIKRNEQQKFFANQILTSFRQVRIKFIDRHAEAVYKILTDEFSKYYRLSELLFSAAKHFPCLVPTCAEMDIEQKKAQADKDGLDIDQGIFLRGLLRSPSVGSHIIDSMLLPSSRALSLLGDLQLSDTVDLGLVLFERRGNAAYLTVNNQSGLNSENNCLIDDMETAVDLVLLDQRINVGVLRGGVMDHPRYLGKRVFSSGINLKDLHAGKISFVDFLLKREFGYISKILHGLLAAPAMKYLATRTIQKPWIAAVDSFAIGGGMQLLFVFDKVIAADDAYFALPAAQEGIIPGAANLRLSSIAGSRLMRQIILSGRKIYATDPEAQLICDEVVPSSKIDESIKNAVNEFDNPAVVENRRMLVLAEEPRDRFREYMAEFAFAQAMRINSSDVNAKINHWARDRSSVRECL